ncbi:MAG: hypothetical protein LUD27_08305 [Clostridia bacterium]|nr:hypothetical protein [Clostridia bacterium]
MKRIFKALFVVITLTLAVISTVCFLRITEYRKILNDVESSLLYEDKGDNSISVQLKSGENLTLIFNDTAVKVVESYKVKDKSEMYRVIRFIRRYAAEHGIEITRKNTDLYGEWKLHNLLYSVNYKRESTADADLDYIRDKRWYVNTMSKLLG